MNFISVLQRVAWIKQQSCVHTLLCFKKLSNIGLDMQFHFNEIIKTGNILVIFYHRLSMLQYTSLFKDFFFIEFNAILLIYRYTRFSPTKHFKHNKINSFCRLISWKYYDKREPYSFPNKIEVVLNSETSLSKFY